VAGRLPDELDWIGKMVYRAGGIDWYVPPALPYSAVEVAHPAF
jgi:hypothetical protein